MTRRQVFLGLFNFGVRRFYVRSFSRIKPAVGQSLAQHLAHLLAPFVQLFEFNTTHRLLHTRYDVDGGRPRSLVITLVNVSLSVC